MLLHFTPTIYCPVGTSVQLVSVYIEELDLRLSANFMVTARRIRSSERYHIACRTGSLKLSSGILVVSPKNRAHFTVVTTWLLGGNKKVTHRVLYQLLDHKNNFASDNPRLWYPTTMEKGGWESVWPDKYSEFTPKHIRPTMFVNPSDRPLDGAALYSREVLDSDGRIEELYQEVSLPTIEPGRLTHHPLSSSMPLLDQIFDAPVQHKRRATDKKEVDALLE